MSAFSNGRAVFACTHALPIPREIGYLILRLFFSGQTLIDIKEHMNDVYERLYQIRPIVLLGSPFLRMPNAALQWQPVANSQLPELISPLESSIFLRGRNHTFIQQQPVDAGPIRDDCELRRWLQRQEHLIDQLCLLKETRQDARLDSFLLEILRHRTLIKGALNRLYESKVFGVFDAEGQTRLLEELKTSLKGLDKRLICFLSVLPSRTDYFEELDGLYSKKGLPSIPMSPCPCCATNSYAYRVVVDSGIRWHRICPACGPLSAYSDGGVMLEIIGQFIVTKGSSWTWQLLRSDCLDVEVQVWVEIEERYSKTLLYSQQFSLEPLCGPRIIMIPSQLSHITAGFHTMRIISLAHGELSLFRRRFLVHPVFKGQEANLDYWPSHSRKDKSGESSIARTGSASLEHG